MPAKMMKLAAAALLCLVPTMVTSNPLPSTLAKTLDAQERLSTPALLPKSLTTNHSTIAAIAARSAPSPRGCWQISEDVEIPPGLLGTRITYCDRGFKRTHHTGFDNPTSLNCGGSCNTWLCEHRPDEHGVSKFAAPNTRCIDAENSTEFYVCDRYWGCRSSQHLMDKAEEAWEAEEAGEKVDSWVVDTGVQPVRKRGGRLLWAVEKDTYMLQLRY